ncbi:oligosaccharide flippase family protein [Tenacibaculum caenipelagi]|uniref:O-antigen/teichoic acid export membrane protein n=1 Tax=Tenacibaculum caenipelagi TaxID=1325435 RepID=A0A4R6TE38_9FLAO|nr:oligosaccharide flippase family protein [Tenacibaculum caenipelagi]TDQ24101.1 O-antigen/teichoic acid export membrane protein [Tenacibaculum caenipelagi]
MRKLFENIGLLTIVKGLDFLIPLIVLPIVISRIGLELFGEYSVLLSFFTFFISFGNFGFNTDAIKDISLNKGDKIKFHEILSEVFSYKIIFSIIAISLFLIIVNLKYEGYFLISLIFSLGILFEVFSLSFYFLAIQKLRFVSFVQILTKLIFGILIVLFVKNESDLLLYVVFTVAATILNSIIIFFLSRKFDFNYELLTIRYEKKRLLSSFNIYSYTFLNNLINPITTYFISINYGNSMTGIFALSQKTYSVFYSAIEPAMNAVYPYLSEQRRVVNNFMLLIKKFFVAFLLISLLAYFVMYFASPYIQLYLLKRVFVGDELILYYLICLMILPSVLNLVSTRVLIIEGRQKEILKILGINFCVILLGYIVVRFFKLEVFYLGMFLVGSSILAMISLVMKMFTTKE